MALLAELVASEELLRREAGALEVVRGEPGPGGERQGILVGVREPLAIGGEAFVAEPLGEVAAVEAEGLLRFRRPAADEPLEAMGVDLEADRRPQPDRVLVGLDDAVGIDPGAVQ